MTAGGATEQPQKQSRQTGTFPRTLARVFKYTVVRMAAILGAVIVAVYLTIFVANLGGFVDEIVKARIDETVAAMVQGGWMRDVPAEVRFEAVEQTIASWREAEGLNEPFLLRCFRWLGKGLLLDWGEAKSARAFMPGRFSTDVVDVILVSLPRTLFIFGVANLLLFFVSISLALALTRRIGSRLDRTFVALSPLSAAPAWVVGILLNLIVFGVLGLTWRGGLLDAWPQEFKWEYLHELLNPLILPFLAIFISGLFQSVYVWRTFFMIHADEDYVEMARAKGLPPRIVERRYILRSVLPAVLTGLALLMVGLWQEVIALEQFFYVHGIGRLFYTALRYFDIAVILGLVVTFAYLLAITVFILDILYALVDPRVRVLSEGRSLGPVAGRRPRLLAPWTWGRRRSAQTPAWADRPRPARRSVREAISDFLGSLRRAAGSLGAVLQVLASHRPALVGLTIISVLVGLSICTIIFLPYEEAMLLWYGEEEVEGPRPKNAAPAWINAVSRQDLPPTINLDTRDSGSLPGEHGAATKEWQTVSDTMREATLSFTFDYPYDALPQEITLSIEAKNSEKTIQLELSWLTADGREIDLGTHTMRSAFSYFPDSDKKLQRRMQGKPPPMILFHDPETGEGPVRGQYQLRVTALVFDETAELDAHLWLDGWTYGLLGTDTIGRDLVVPFLWGTPIALSFGLLAAVLTSVCTMTFAGIGVWFGGWADSLIQRLTEVNMILPFLPVAIMIFTLYSRSFWVVIGVTVLLSIFGRTIKNYRAMFLQLKEAPYIEAAQAYGAGDWRIIFHYLAPRIGAVLIPQIVVLIPTYVFLEATLAFLDVPIEGPPTWGTLVIQLMSRDSYFDDWGVVLIPLGLLLLTGFAFALVGMGMERYFEPRLRDR
jgi:peptide/nickel transport system permease protein